MVSLHSTFSTHMFSSSPTPLIVSPWTREDSSRSEKYYQHTHNERDHAYQQYRCWLSGDICPGSDIEFSCVGNSESISTTRWEITPDGGGDPACIVAHNQPDEMQNCGPDRIFTSSLTGRTGLNYTSSLRAEDVPLSLNGTMVECVDGADLQTIGSTNICIVGKHDPFHCVYVDNISQICWSPLESRVIQSVELEMRRTCVY